MENLKYSNSIFIFMTFFSSYKYKKIDKNKSYIKKKIYFTIYLDPSMRFGMRI